MSDQAAPGGPTAGASPDQRRPAPESALLYETIHQRRDVRGEFNGAPVDDAALQRVLEAANAAPSVGLTQPWDFILVDDAGIKSEFSRHVEEERRTFMASLDAERAETFSHIKIEGIREATLSVVVTYDPSRGAPSILGGHAIADTGLYSTCLAIENMWLAATAEGWGLGWVSFYREEFLSRLLGLPAHVRPIAWLCVGPVTHLQTTPDLERFGWRKRRPLAEFLHTDRW